MATKTKNETVLHVWMHDDFKDKLRKYRAKMQLQNQPITSDEKAIMKAAEVEFDRILKAS